MSVKNAKKEESFVIKQSFSEASKASYLNDGKVQSSVSNTSPSKTSGNITETSFFVRVDSTSLGNIFSISTPQKLHPYLALDMNGSLPKLKAKIETLETELGKINPKDLEQIKKITNRLDFLNRANEILKSTPEISPLFLSTMVEAALSDQPDQTHKALKGLEVLQRLRAREESRQQLVLRVVQEYPEASPLVGEIDFSRQNSRILSYHSNGYITPQQLAAIDQPPIGTLQASPLGLAYDDLKMTIPESAKEVQAAFIRLIQYQSSPFSLSSVEAIEEEITRIERITDPLISKFLLMVEDQRKKLLKKDPQVQTNEEFRSRVAAVSPHLFILSALESSPENFQAKGESLESYQSYFLNLRKKLQAEYETASPQGEMFLPNGDWEKSPAKKIADRLENVDQAIASIDSMSDATPEAAMLRYARVRLDFELKENEPFLVKAVENKLKQVEEIPSNLKNDELKEIRENFLASRNLSPQERVQFYAKTFGELDSIAFPRTVNVKLEMLNAGRETVGITDRTINWLVNIPRRSIGGEKDSIELSNQRSTLEIIQKRYQEVQGLMNAGKIDEAKNLFLSLEQSTLKATAADRVEFSTSYNRYAVGLGLVAAAGGVGYTAGVITEPLIGGALNLLLVNSPLFWGTFEYLDAKTKGLKVNPFYHPEETGSQNAFRITKGVLYTYGALKFIGMVNKNYWEGARIKLFAQAEKEMMVEGTLTEVALKGSVEEGWVAARASAIQSQFFTQVRLQAGAYAHEVLALGGWEFTQANIDFALEKQFHPIVAVTHTLFSLDGWKHRAVFVAGLKLEGKVSQNLGYRQIAELIRDQGYQIKFNALENQIRTAESRLQEFQKLAETDPEKLPPSEKLLPFLASYRKGLEQQLEMAKNLSARGIELDGLQYLSNRATELLQLKALEAFTQARANFFKQNGIDPITKNIYRYAANQGLELVTQLRKEGKEIKIGENGILSIKQGDETLRLIPSKQPSQSSLAQMRKALSPSEPQNSFFSRLVDGVIAVFEEPDVLRLALAGALPFLAGNSSPIQDAPTWVKVLLGGAVTVILWKITVKVIDVMKADEEIEKNISNEKKSSDSISQISEILRNNLVLEALTNISSEKELNNWIKKYIPQLPEKMKFLFIKLLDINNNYKGAFEYYVKNLNWIQLLELLEDLNKFTQISLDKKVEFINFFIDSTQPHLSKINISAALDIDVFNTSGLSVEEYFDFLKLILKKKLTEPLADKPLGLAWRALIETTTRLNITEKKLLITTLIERSDSYESFMDFCFGIKKISESSNFSPITMNEILKLLSNYFDLMLLLKGIYNLRTSNESKATAFDFQSKKPLLLSNFLLFPQQPFYIAIYKAQLANVIFQITEMRNLAEYLGRALKDNSLHTKTHAEYLPTNGAFYEQKYHEYLEKCELEGETPNIDIVYSFKRIIHLYREVLENRINVEKYKPLLNDQLLAELEFPASEHPNFEEINRLSLSLRKLVENKRSLITPRDLVVLTDLAILIQNHIFSKCTPTSAERGTAKQAQKMATLVYGLYASGYGNRGWIEVAQSLERISQNWNNDSERELRIYAALTREMVLKVQDSYHQYFDPQLKQYEKELDKEAAEQTRFGKASGLVKEQENRALFTSMTYREMAVSQLARHVQELGVTDGNREAAQSVLNLLVRQVNASDTSPLTPQFYQDVRAFPQDPILVGGKGLGLSWLTEWVPKKVPKGFVLAPRPAGYKLSDVERINIQNGIRVLEKRTGKKFGNGLAVSIRSGAAISMPGAMQTQLNVRSMDDLYRSIENVYASWNSTAAKEYRLANGIPDQWGTAVNVVQMIDGTKANSGSGVAHSSSGGSHPITIAYSAQHVGEVVVGGQSSATSKLPESLAQELAADMKNFEKRYGEKTGVGHPIPIEVEFTVESGKLYYLQIRRALLEENQKVEWYAQKAREGTVSKPQALQALGGSYRLEQMKQVTVIAPGQNNTILYQGAVGIGKPVTGEIAFNTEQVAATIARGAKAVLVTDNPDARESTAGAIQARGVLLVTQTPASDVAHLLGVARTQGLSLMQMSGGKGTLSSEGGIFSLRVGAQVYHQGDLITLEPNSPMTIDGPSCREGPRSRLYVGAMQMTQGPNPHLPAIEFLINP